jgi:uracil-DNA glycosylase family 4
MDFEEVGDVEKAESPVYVPPDGHRGQWVVCGEAPAREEVRLGRGFVGASGQMLWPLLLKYAGLDRSACWVTNLCKHPLDDDADEKMTEEEFVECCDQLMEELGALRKEAGGPLSILAVGAYAARALLGDAYTQMDVVCGWGFDHPLGTVVPVFHPAAALRGAGDKDPLAWLADGVAHFRKPRRAVKLEVPLAGVMAEGAVWDDSWPVVGVDTEGTPDDPICMTIATNEARMLVWPKDVPRVYDSIRRKTVVMHNGLWDWGVLEAMGVSRPWDVARFCDTMQMAYLKQTEPQGLKDLGYRHFGIHMKTFEELVEPVWGALLRAYAEGVVAAGTTTITHSPKTGRQLKRPKVILADDVKPINRAIGNVKLLASRLPGFPPPTLRLVAEDDFIDYATLDAFVTHALFFDLGGRV